MELLIGAAIYALIIQKLWAEARTDHELAKQGKISPRLEAKYGAGAAAKVAKYGFLDHLRDAWNDYWPRRTDALIAARDAKAANPGEKVRLRDRLAAARNVVGGIAKKAAASPVVQSLIKPVEPKPAATTPEPVGAPPLAVDTGDVPDGTRRFTDTGQEEFRDGRWQPVPKNPDTFGVAPDWPLPPRLPDVQPPKPAPSTPSTGGTMSAPTGEAVNYETAVAELEALAREQRGHVDQCLAALQHIGAAKASIGDMQESYRASSDAAASTAEHLAAKNLDGVTLSHAGTTVDAMPAGKVDAMFDQLEAMEVEAQQRLADAEVALGATEANLRHIQATYGDAHATVAGNLGGDSSFLDGGAAGSAPAPNTTGQPAGSPWATSPGGSPASAGPPSSTGSDSPGNNVGPGGSNVTVHDQPVNASGQAFGSGNVTNNTGDVAEPAPAPSTPGQHSTRIVFNGPVDARNSHAGSGNVTNNN